MSNLANYNQSGLDKTFPDHEETVFGHMVIEMGMPPAIAAQKLKPWVKNFTRSSESAKKIGYGMGFSGVLVGILIGATSGIGLVALMPALAGAWCINDGLTSTKEHSAREAEYLMLMECPELVKLIFALSQRGLSADVLVEAYDDLVRSYGDSVQEGSDIDKYAIVSHFQMLIGEKSHLAGVTAAMVDELNVTVFDDLYDRESDAPLAGQGSKSQARNGETVEFDDFGTGLNALPASGRRPTVEEAIAALSLPDLTVEEFIETTPVNDRLLDRSEIQSIEILDGLVASQRSTLLVGGTGAGKSVTQAYLLVNLLKRCPTGDVFVISQKMDAFAGLNAIGRVTLFNPIDPAESLSIIDKVWNIYDQRRRLSEHQRNLPPVRLLLCDWLSINAALESDKSNAEVKESRYLAKLVDIIYNGRELNVCLWIDLQSFNVKAIGMQTDANGRKNFNILGLGNYYVDANGGVNESYGVLSNMIQSKFSPRSFKQKQQPTLGKSMRFIQSR